MQIYVCKAASDLLKIGIAADPKRRLGQLQIGNPFRLKMVYSVEIADVDAHKAEHHIHKLLRRRRAHMNGEWFRYEPDKAIALVDRIAAMFTRRRTVAADEEAAPAGTILRHIYCQQCFNRGTARSPVGQWPRCRCSKCGNANPLIGGRDRIRPWWAARKSR